jgi:hypothetical protein
MVRDKYLLVAILRECIDGFLDCKLDLDASELFDRLSHDPAGIWSDKLIEGHILLLHDAGLVEIFKDLRGPRISRVKWDGYDYFEAAKKSIKIKPQ